MAEGWYIYWLDWLIGSSHLAQTRIFCRSRRRRGATAHVEGLNIDRQSRIILREFYRRAPCPRRSRRVPIVELYRSANCKPLLRRRSIRVGGVRSSLRGGSPRRVRRGHAAEKIPRITTGPEDASTDRTKNFFLCEYYCAQRCIRCRKTTTTGLDDKLMVKTAIA